MNFQGKLLKMENEMNFIRITAETTKRIILDIVKSNDNSLATTTLNLKEVIELIDKLKEWLEISIKSEKKDTIKVRIPVATTQDNDDGKPGWSAIGDSDLSDIDSLEKSVRQTVSDRGPVRVSWITAEIPLPDEVEIKGKVD